MTLGLWERGRKGRGAGIWRGPVAGRRQNGVSCRKGPTSGAKERKSQESFWEPRVSGGPAWRRFRSLGSERQAVLGSSLEPVILQPRVTWMPGIPEPLGCSAPACPPPLPPCLAQRPWPAAALGGKSEHKGRLGLAGGGGSLSLGERHIPLILPQLALPSCPLLTPYLQALLSLCSDSSPPRQIGPWFYPGG